MPGRPSSCRRRSTAGVISPRFSATSGTLPSSASRAQKSSAPGAAGGPPARRRVVGRRRAPLALEAHLVEDGALAGVARPVADPVALPRDEGVELLCGGGRVGLCQQACPAGEG